MPRRPSLRRSGTRLDWIAALLLVLLTWTALGGVVRNGFVNYDDELYLTGNTALTGGLGVAAIAGAFTTTRGGNWHPLTWVSHLIDVQLFGMNPGAHHAVSLALHCANALLLFALLRGLTGALWPSALVAALFAVHPLHVESVAWASERKDVLSTLFALLAARVYVRAVRRPGDGAARAAVPALFALALLAKPMPISLPLLLLLLDWWPLGRWSPFPSAGAPRAGAPLFGFLPPVRLWVEKAPLLLLSAISGVVTWTVQAEAGAMLAADNIPFPARAVNAVVAYALYLRKTIWPDGLAIFYPYPWDGHPPLTVLLASLLLTVLAAAAWHQSRRRPWVAVGLLWYFVALLPAVGLVQVGIQAMADRYTYLPLVGIFTAAAWGLAEIAGNGRRAAQTVAVLSLVATGLLGAVAARQVDTWRDGVTLFSQAIAVTGSNPVAENNLGNALLARGSVVESLAHFEATIRIAPDLPKGYLNLGRALAKLGRDEEAVGRFRAAIAIDRDNPLAYRNLAQSLERLGRREEALAASREVLRLQPRDPRALDMVGVALARAGRPGEAVPLLERAVALEPGNPTLRDHLAVARAQLAARSAAGPSGRASAP